MSEKKTQIITPAQVIEIIDLYSKIVDFHLRWRGFNISETDADTYQRFYKEWGEVNRSYYSRISILMREMGLI